MVCAVLIAMLFLLLVSWQCQRVSDFDYKLHRSTQLNSTLATKEYQNSPEFRHFKRQIFHSSLHHILLPLRDHMLVPRVTRCADGHFRRVIYGLGPYIADYPEQALLACIVQGWCARYVKSKVIL